MFHFIWRVAGRSSEKVGPEGPCSPTAGSFGVSAQIGSGVVRGGPEVRFHKGFHRGFTRVPRGSARAVAWCDHEEEHHMLLGMSPELIFLWVKAVKVCILSIILGDVARGGAFWGVNMYAEHPFDWQVGA